VRSKLCFSFFVRNFKFLQCHFVNPTFHRMMAPLHSAERSLADGLHQTDQGILTEGEGWVWLTSFYYFRSADFYWKYISFIFTIQTVLTRRSAVQSLTLQQEFPGQTLQLYVLFAALSLCCYAECRGAYVSRKRTVWLRGEFIAVEHLNLNSTVWPKW
jgi:hypothetical protein